MFKQLKISSLVLTLCSSGFLVFNPAPVNAAPIVTMQCNSLSAYWDRIKCRLTRFTASGLPAAKIYCRQINGPRATAVRITGNNVIDENKCDLRTIVDHR